MIYIAIEEEFGYRDWIWAFPGTPAEALAEWKAGRRPVYPLVDGDFKGTVHQVDYTYPWSGKTTSPKFHCEDKKAMQFCDACNEITVVEYTACLTETTTPFPAITNQKQFAGVGHVHEKEDTYLAVKDAGYFHDAHAECPEGCQSCAECRAHTRTMSDRDYKCAVCAQPLCTVCSGCQETAFCGYHNVVDAVAALEDA